MLIFTVSKLLYMYQNGSHIGTAKTDQICSFIDPASKVEYSKN